MDGYDYMWIKYFQKPLIQLLILAAIRLKAPVHGYGILTFINRFFPSINLKAGTLYPILTRFKQNQLIEEVEVWEENNIEGPPRKYYMLTKTGTDVLNRMIDSYQQYTALIEEIIEMIKKS